MVAGIKGLPKYKTVLDRASTNISNRRLRGY